MIKCDNIQKEDLLRLELIKSGCELSLVELFLKDKECCLFVAPTKTEEEELKFVELYNSYKDDDGQFSHGVFDLENLEGDIKDYVCISKREYEDYLKFKEARRTKLIDKQTQEQIKAKYKELKSQRAVAKEFKTSVATINRIVKNIY